MDYLALPVVLRNGYFIKADLAESIAYSIGLILSTRRGTMAFEPDFGCEIWDKEYSDLYSANKANIRSSIRNAIDKYEKRVYNTSVSLAGFDNAAHDPLGLRVKVSANYREDGEERKFERTFRVG